MEVPAIVQRVHFILQFLNLNRKLIHSRLTFLFLSGKFTQLQYSKYFSILPCLEVFQYEFLEELFLDLPILYGASLSLSGNDHMTASLGGVPCVENESVGLTQ